MTRQELRMFLDSHLCGGCGSPESVAGVWLRLLRLHPVINHREEMAAWIRDEGVRYFLLYELDHAGLTEHGTSVDGAWLTAKGQAVCDALARESVDGFEKLLVQHCAHGYDFDDNDHDCLVAERIANGGPK